MIRAMPLAISVFGVPRGFKLIFNLHEGEVFLARDHTVYVYQQGRRFRKSVMNPDNLILYQKTGEAEL